MIIIIPEIYERFLVLQLMYYMPISALITATILTHASTHYMYKRKEQLQMFTWKVFGVKMLLILCKHKFHKCLLCAK